MGGHEHDGIEHEHDPNEAGPVEVSPDAAHTAPDDLDAALADLKTSEAALALARSLHGTPVLRADACDDQDHDAEPDTVVTTKTVCAVCDYPAGLCGHSPNMMKEVPVE
jgi:hypothetical protein